VLHARDRPAVCDSRQTAVQISNDLAKGDFPTDLPSDRGLFQHVQTSDGLLRLARLGRGLEEAVRAGAEGCDHRTHSGVLVVEIYPVQEQVLALAWADEPPLVFP